MCFHSVLALFLSHSCFHRPLLGNEYKTVIEELQEFLLHFSFFLSFAKLFLLVFFLFYVCPSGENKCPILQISTCVSEKSIELASKLIISQALLHWTVIFEKSIFLPTLVGGMGFLHLAQQAQNREIRKEHSHLECRPAGSLKFLC